MRRLNANITEEAFDILQERAKKYGTSMGAMITMMLLQLQREDQALDGLALYKAQTEKVENQLK